ncbi:hypothetical protein BATDEDRAFT_91799 [Batrachochytrium dendrobatidis JAM81]|uniref:RxLR effector protein n=1 Tax=Batrachochytrium dendrobatidis (strain JAM81 / FGSC 10211) TaxID=684364 RepID=F4PB74_BATDJ|nr:uncharacterized protein BATDEDRAFT_91799 [Batrachochytrium dendrobatidis JAM81]EGF77274.1 hypothetical protein BATDEDRAFT_91799 [Batrachochytrium dendrobatidis JAM81]KAJ8327772.1 hypothetical protein O5D80_004107 [Batrachochytrium dendrobatidis]KAK5669402.1 hypothetical protein QVD99_003797 [Batrachochytrium dendrobatidis]|eukprot:XP_006682027.1 hypothetical protein BATDEDRAFT_91799 [Batrachochytrium dendrobatidis JAM81]
MKFSITSCLAMLIITASAAVIPSTDDSNMSSLFEAITVEKRFDGSESTEAHSNVLDDLTQKLQEMS